MVIFDTNALLRFILQDNEEMADLVEKELEAKPCFIPVEVIAEMVYVLSKVYKVQRGEIALAVRGVLEIENISVPEVYVIYKALELYSGTKLDFVDCLMIGYARINGYSVFTFDKDLKKHL